MKARIFPNLFLSARYLRQNNLNNLLFSLKSVHFLFFGEFLVLLLNLLFYSHLGIFRVFVGGISSNTTESELHQLFSGIYYHLHIEIYILIHYKNKFNPQYLLNIFFFNIIFSGGGGVRFCDWNCLFPLELE